MRVISLPRRSHYRDILYGASLLCVAMLVPVTAYAVTALSEGFSSNQPLSLGSIVSLEKNSTDTVVPASMNNSDNILGVVINHDSSLLSVTNSKKEQVQVATSGTVPVIVSDINGEIKRGDHITASPLSGVGMKATANVRIVGIAQGDVTSMKKESYKDQAGKEHSVTLGEVPTLVNVAYFFKEPEKTVVPRAIQSVANAIAGKSVSTLPVVLSIAVFLIMIIVVCSIVYSMIKSSIISIGRNPMSQAAVYRDMVQMSALVLAILSVGLISIYFILTRL